MGRPLFAAAPNLLWRCNCMLAKQEKPCPNCETGKKDYELDKHSVFCSNIHCLHGNECCKFVPMGNVNKKLL